MKRRVKPDFPALIFTKNNLFISHATHHIHASIIFLHFPATRDQHIPRRRLTPTYIAITYKIKKQN